MRWYAAAAFALLVAATLWVPLIESESWDGLEWVDPAPPARWGLVAQVWKTEEAQVRRGSTFGLNKLVDHEGRPIPPELQFWTVRTDWHLRWDWFVAQMLGVVVLLAQLGGLFFAHRRRRIQRVIARPGGPPES